MGSSADGVGNSMTWLHRQEAALAAPTVEARLREEQPLLIMLAWGIIIWTLLRQASTVVKQLALPGLQACGLQLLTVIACNAVSATFIDARLTHRILFGFLDRFVQGLAMLIACVILPRRVVNSYMPREDLRRHYLRKLRDIQPQRKYMKTRGLAAPAEASDAEGLLASSVQSRLRMALWFSRSSAVLLMLVRPITAPLLQETNWRISSMVVDTLTLAICTIMVWAAGNELTRDILHKVLPSYRQLAFLVTSMAWAFHLQHLFLQSRGSQQNFLEQDHELLMMRVVHVGEVAFIVCLAAKLLCASRDPLVQLALLRLGAQEASEASEDEAVTELSDQGLRCGCCRLCLAFWDVRRLLRELLFESLPWPLRVQSEEMDESEGSDSEESSEITRVSPEVSAGTAAWQSWKARTGVHQAWYGNSAPAHVQRDASMPMRVPTQAELSPQENFELEKALILGNSWWRVPADLFSDRVRSKFLAVVMVVILVVMSYSHNVFERVIGEFPNPVEALGVQLCLMGALWVLFGLLVFGNNAFVSYKNHRRWILFMGLACLGIAFTTVHNFFANTQQGFEGGGAVCLGDVIDDAQQRWADMSVSALSFLACFLALNLYMSPEDSNDFHHCEFNALWYTTDLLQCSGPVRSLRKCPPQAGEHVFFLGRSNDGMVKAVVDKDHGDGTCDATLADGRRLARERHKFFRRPSQLGVEETLDSQLARLKALRKASEDYPAVLYLGAISSLPLLLAVACGVLLAVRTVLHKVYRLHVYCSLLSFCINAVVVPPGPAGDSPVARQALATGVAAWRLGGGLGLPDAEHLPRVANVSGLNYRMSNDNTSESTPCSQLPQGKHLVMLLGMGYEAGELRLPLVQRAVTHTLRVLWGVDGRAIDAVSDGIQRLWAGISAGDKDFALDAAKAGELLCEAKLLSSVRLKSAGQGALIAAYNLAASVALNATRGLEDELETTSFNWPVVGPGLDFARRHALALLRDLEPVLEGWANGTLASAQAVDAMESGLEHSAPFIKAAAHLAEGKAPDVQTVISLLDSDGDGKLSLSKEAPGLVNLGMKLCRSAGCGHMVESKVWEALAYADKDGDGELSVEDVRSVGKALKESFKSGRRLLHGVCGIKAVPGHAAGQAVGAAAMTVGAIKAPNYEDLLNAFDANGDGALSLQEVMHPVGKLLPEVPGKASCFTGVDASAAEASAKHAVLGEVLTAFRKADVNGDGRLSVFESLGNLGSAVSKLCPAPQPGATGTTSDSSATARLLQDELKDEAEIVFHVFDVDLGQAGAVASSIIGDLAKEDIAFILIAVNWVLYFSLFCAAICQLYVIGRCFSRYREFFESMQSGRHNYVGHTQRRWLESSFSQTTLFPGMLFGTTFFGFLLVAALVFSLLVLTIVLCLPFWASFWQRVYPMLIYLTVALCLKLFISYVVINMWLAEEGEITYPGCFSLFWFVQLFLNFVLGISTACFRAVLVLIWAVISCCFVDFTLLSESLVCWDSAYYSLLTTAYTHHIQRNPVKKAMVTALFRHIQSIHQRAGHKECADSEELAEGGRQAAAKGSSSFGKGRARFLLALTLHHNPELMQMRQRAVEPPGN